jgi:hypothetical protein
VYLCVIRALTISHWIEAIRRDILSGPLPGRAVTVGDSLHANTMRPNFPQIFELGTLLLNSVGEEQEGKSFTKISWHLAFYFTVRFDSGDRSPSG